jgi:hypothetical protein
MELILSLAVDSPFHKQNNSVISHISKKNGIFIITKEAVNIPRELPISFFN